MRLGAMAAVGCLAAAAAHGATFNVTSLDDAGPGSLRQAVIDANASPGADTITFGVTGTITLTSGLILITDALSIQGPGSAQLAIDGSGNNRIFAIVENNAPACPELTGPSDYLVTVSGLTLRNGQRNVSNSVGGAIYTVKSLSVDDVTFENNRARGGGALWFATQYPGQSLTVQNSRFIGNQAREIVAVTTLGHVGGAIGNAELCGNTRTQPVTVTIADSVFADNVAQAGTTNARGGAIYFCCDADVTITRTTIDGNKALPPTTPNPNVNAQGGGVSGSSQTLTIRDSTISANEAERSAALHLFNDAQARQTFQERMRVDVINSTVSGNHASQFRAVLAFANVDFRVHNSTLVGNRSDQYRTGGIYLATGPTVPASASNATPPTLLIESSVLWNPLSSADVAKDDPTMPGVVAVPSNDSLIGRICDAACGAGTINLVGAGNLFGIDPLLGQLADNGGPTMTRLPQLGSPVIGAGSNPLGLTTDQRGAGFPRTIGAVTDMGATEYAYAAQCEGFLDVLGNSPFCPSVAWMKSRNVTTGCGGGNYCPGSEVNRLAMAAFMQRLGLQLSGFAILTAVPSGLLDFATAPVVCQTDPVPPSAAPRLAVIDGVFAGLAGADTLGRMTLAISEDGGTTWVASPQLYTMRATFNAGLWRNVHITSRHDVEATKTLRFGLRMDLPTGGAGGVTDSMCRLRVRIENSGGFTPL